LVRCTRGRGRVALRRPAGEIDATGRPWEGAPRYGKFTRTPMVNGSLSAPTSSRRWERLLTARRERVDVAAPGRRAGALSLRAKGSGRAANESVAKPSATAQLRCGRGQSSFSTLARRRIGARSATRQVAGAATESGSKRDRAKRSAQPGVLYERRLSGADGYPHQDEAVIEVLSDHKVVLGRRRGRRSRWWPSPRTSLRWRGPHELLHSGDQGAGGGEVLRAVRDVRRREMSAWLPVPHRSTGRADRVLHARGAGRNRAAGRRGRRCRRGRDGRRFTAARNRNGRALVSTVGASPRPLYAGLLKAKRMWTRVPRSP
jgi:hypothetical protein